ncbi:dihydrolipoamide dehydrogenase [Roseiarcus fermentans]|uniref:Dihydrolipoyl dehydrogenase n=1 Tax=Roseiarcus fermentans TaxID=1473586 RepID=A0A366FRJ0_9HYPH|nr:dihydrolipoyl dehydrogenase [Roseiarcus fermentans]RBP16776.1 dihydrolipoamide dehydrogenase [Roseiarcus fermentans]
MPQEIRLPDIGDFHDVPVIEIHVKPGDPVKKEQTLVTLESDKATLDVPAPADGVIGEFAVKIGDKVSQGSLIATFASVEGEVASPAPAAHPTPPPPPPAHVDFEAEIVVLGAGPGGYTAAFRAADLGEKVLIVDKHATLGGVCLNVGCIPSKALLHVAKTIDEAAAMGAHGVAFGAPTIDLDAIRAWKDSVVKRLTTGLTGLARQRKVTVVRGEGAFTSQNTLRVETAEGPRTVRFAKAIIAAGSEPVAPGFIPTDKRIWDSTAALEMRFAPERLLILGGGIIGLEMATVYRALGSKITVIEMMDQLMPGADPDIVAPLAKRLGKLYDKILLKTKVTAVEAKPEGLIVSYEGADGTKTETFDAMLVSVGRRPNGKAIGAEAAGVKVDERGFIAVDREMRTNIHHIFAIGDIVGQPMLAHKASHEGKVAAEVASGHKSAFDAKVIPSVAYTDPEVAWVGPTETELKAKGVKYGKAVFPWAASGRSLALGRDEGLTKTLWDEATNRLIGCGIVGTDAGDLISEAALAIEMGSEAEDIGLTIHPHPTLSETFAMSAEAFAGTLTDLYMPKKT